MSSPDHRTTTATMSEGELFDPAAYIDSLVTDPMRLRDRVHNSGAGEGLLVASTIAYRYDRMARRGTDPKIIVDNYVGRAVSALSEKDGDKETVETELSTVLQLWEGYFRQHDHMSLLAATEQRMEELPSQAEHYGLTQDEAQQVVQRFRNLTAVTEKPHENT